MKRFLARVLTGVTAIMLLAAPLAAESGTAEESSWQFDFTPYLWIAGVDGDVSIGSFETGGVDASFEDITGNLEFAFMGSFEARKRHWGILLDALYLDLSATADTPDRAIGDVDAELKVGLYSLAGLYRLMGNPLALDLLGGGRWVTLDVDLEVEPGEDPRIFQGRSASGSDYWVEGFVGMRALVPLSERWSLVGYADVGAGNSNYTFQGIAGVNFKLAKHFVIKGGLRFLIIDAEPEPIDLNLKMAGPYLGLGILF